MRRKNKTSNSHLKLTRFLTCLIALCKCWLMTNPSVAVHHTISPARLTVVVIFFMSAGLSASKMFYFFG